MSNKSLAIAILGYGRMGKAIEEQAIQRGHRIVCKIDNEHDWQTCAPDLEKAHVAIEFSIPEVTLSNMHRCFERRLPVVVGTTGWYNHMSEVKSICEQHKAGCIWGANFSIGMNLFFKTATYLSELMQAFPDYKATIHEVHHTKKLDAPSGTAIAIANTIGQVNAKWHPWYLLETEEEAPKATGLPISYVRQGEVFGEHYLHFDAAADSLMLKHEAHNRSGFATGAVMAAEYIYDKTGFYAFADLFQQKNQ